MKKQARCNIRILRVKYGASNKSIFAFICQRTLLLARTNKCCQFAQRTILSLNACEPESLDAPVAIRLNIDSNGSVISVEIDSKPLPECMTKEMQQWTFLEHHEETAVLHLSITVRESTFYLLPGSFVEQRHVKQRYWMPYPLEKPFKHTDESPGSKSSEHFIEDQ